MKSFTPTRLAVAVSAHLALTAGYAPTAFSQDVSELEEVVVTGSRAAPRSVYDSAAPIDVITRAGRWAAGCRRSDYRERSR